MGQNHDGKNIAVVLAAGTGSRMHAGIPKQFIMLAGHPLIYYALKTMEVSEVIDECILVTGEDDIERMQTEIVGKYGFHKVKAVISGGKERCYSVANAMRWISEHGRETKEKVQADGCDYLFIHDGARPFVTEEILGKTYCAAKESGACVAAMPSKDTVKLADQQGYAVHTPDRNLVWMIQTPQVFEKDLIINAYASFERDMKEKQNESERVPVTDDASVVERYTDVKVKLVEASYSNIKITTPEDLLYAEMRLGVNNQ